MVTFLSNPSSDEGGLAIMMLRSTTMPMSRVLLSLRCVSSTDKLLFILASASDRGRVQIGTQFLRLGFLYRYISIQSMQRASFAPQYTVPPFCSCSAASLPYAPVTHPLRQGIVSRWLDRVIADSENGGLCR